MQVSELFEDAVGEKPATVSWQPANPPGIARGDYTLVWVDIAKLDAAWQRDREHYIGPGGTGAKIGRRYPDFGTWLANRGEEKVKTPEVYIMPESAGPRRAGAVSFGNGRHRFSWLRDHGAKSLPVQVDVDQAAEFEQRFGTRLRRTLLRMPVTEITETVGIRSLVEAAAHPFREIAAHLTKASTGGNLPIHDLRARIKALLQGWRGRTFRNIDTGHNIILSRVSVNKTTAVGDALLRIHHALPQILERGVFMSADSPRENRPEMIEMLNLGASVTLDGTLLHVIAKIRRYPQASHHYSLHYDGDIQIVPYTNIGADAPPDFNPAGGEHKPI